MDLLIRVADESGGHSDTEHSVDKLMLGSANEAHIQLPLLDLRHATLVSAKGGLLLRSIVRDGVQVNGNVAKQALLQVGDLVDLPGATLHIEEAPTGFDGLIVVRRAAGHTSSLSAQKLDLSETLLAKRAFAWLGALLIVVGMFVVPFLFSGDRAADAPMAALFSDQVWTCLLYTSPSPRDATLSRMPSSA